MMAVGKNKFVCNKCNPHCVLECGYSEPCVCPRGAGTGINIIPDWKCEKVEIKIRGN